METTKNKCEQCRGSGYVCTGHSPKADCRYWHDAYDGNDCAVCSRSSACPTCNGTGVIRLEQATKEERANENRKFREWSSKEALESWDSGNRCVVSEEYMPFGHILETVRNAIQEGRLPLGICSKCGGLRHLHIESKENYEIDCLDGGKLIIPLLEEVLCDQNHLMNSREVDAVFYRENRKSLGLLTAEEIREKRIILGMSHQDIVDKFEDEKVTEERVRDWEHNATIVPQKHDEKLREILGITKS